MSVYSGCLSASVSHKPQVQVNFLYKLLAAVVRSSSDGTAISCILPVFWITSCFHIIQKIDQNQRRRVYFVQFARWRHWGEDYRIRLHLVLFFSTITPGDALTVVRAVVVEVCRIVLLYKASVISEDLPISGAKSPKISYRSLRWRHSI